MGFVLIWSIRLKNWGKTFDKIYFLLVFHKLTLFQLPVSFFESELIAKL